MAKRRDERGASPPAAAPSRPWLAPIAIGLAIAVAVVGFLVYRDRSAAPASPSPASGSLPSGAPPSGAAPAPTETMEVAKAVVVSTEIAYPTGAPTVAQALSQIERRYAPDDGAGRTFAILDADGWPTQGGKALHLQMHISSEKPGVGSLVYRPTGEVLWSTRILGAPAPALKELTIYVDDGKGGSYTVDGSKNPPSVLEATVRETGAPVKEIWPDGAERELTFVFSACGCPVKVTARRQGDRAVRVPSKRLDGSVRPADLPVMFPDDPAAVATIARLMRW